MYRFTLYYLKYFINVLVLLNIPISLLFHVTAPAPAREVTATVLSPLLARVEWTTQPDLWYQLYWATNESDHFQHKFQGNVTKLQ